MANIDPSDLEALGTLALNTLMQVAQEGDDQAALNAAFTLSRQWDNEKCQRVVAATYARLAGSMATDEYTRLRAAEYLLDHVNSKRARDELMAACTARQPAGLNSASAVAYANEKR